MKDLKAVAIGVDPRLPKEKSSPNLEQGTSCGEQKPMQSMPGGRLWSYISEVYITSHTGHVSLMVLLPCPVLDMVTVVKQSYAVAV